jgi:glycosyltransferase involved in cell wall biosynthesis
LSNILIGGFLPALRRRLNAPVIVTLQGDDLFLADLPPADQAAAIEEIARLGESVDVFLTFTNYYADFMSAWLRLPREKFAIVPLGIDASDLPVDRSPRPADDPPTIGYLARHCRAKGLHVLVEAYLKLRAARPGQTIRLHTAGWQGEADRPYIDENIKRIREAGFAGDCHFAGIVDRRGKAEFLAGIDVFSVPTTYREPKGLFVLEALACGIPVVEPNHGALTELLAATGGGVLVPPNDVDALADAIGKLIDNPAEAKALGHAGQQRVRDTFHARAAAAATRAIYESVRP